MMKLNYAAEYRAAAREALRGKWPMAVLVGLVASILTGFQINEPAFSVNLNLETDANSLPFADLFYEAANNIPYEFYYLITAWTAWLAVIAVLSVIIGIIFLILGGPVATGYAQYNMKLVSGEPAGFADLFSQFKPALILRAFLANLIQTVIVMAATFIGALLFVIPGIIAGIYLGYSFSMTFYILADHPEYGPWQAVKESFRMMQGHKFRYFRLELSFIGWAILAAFTCGIGSLFLVPYQNTAYAIFYLELAGDYFAFRAANPEVRY